MENTIYCKTELIEEINALIQRWSDERPQTRTLAHLSRETGVSDSALRRLRNQKVKISDDMLYRVVNTIFENPKFSDLKTKVSQLPTVSKWLMRHYSFLENTPGVEDYKYTEVSDEIVLNPIAFSVFALVSSIDGVTKEYLKEQFGLRGVLEADSFVKKSIFDLKDGIYVLGSASNKVKISKNAVISLMPELTKLYLNTDSEVDQYIFECDGLTKNGYLELSNAMVDFYKRSAEIISRNKGNIPFILSGFLNTMTVDPVKMEN